MKLYELTSAYSTLWDLVDNEDSDLSMIETALQTVESSIELKASNIVIFLKSLDNDAKAIKEEEQRLSARRRAIENKHASIKSYLQAEMEIAGIEKLKTATHSLSLQNNPPALQIFDNEAIPQKYLTLVPEHYEVRKDEVKAAIKAGEVVPGAEISIGRSIRIR